MRNYLLSAMLWYHCSLFRFDFILEVILHIVDVLQIPLVEILLNLISFVLTILLIFNLLMQLGKHFGLLLPSYAFAFCLSIQIVLSYLLVILVHFLVLIFLNFLQDLFLVYLTLQLINQLAFTFTLLHLSLELIPNTYLV